MFNKQIVTQLYIQYIFSVHNKLEMTQLSLTSGLFQCKTHLMINNSTCILQQLYNAKATNLTVWKTKHHWAESDLNSRKWEKLSPTMWCQPNSSEPVMKGQNIGTKMGDHARLQYWPARITNSETVLYYPVNNKRAFPTWANRFPSVRRGRLERWHRTTRWQSSSTVLKKRRVGSNASRSITSSKNRSQ